MLTLDTLVNHLPHSSPLKKNSRFILHMKNVNSRKFNNLPKVKELAGKGIRH